MIYKSPLDLVFGDIFLEIPELLSHCKLFLKLEGLSLTGSIKIKSALRMLNRLEFEGVLRPGMSVIESSSGNLGLALAMVCAVKRYPFICVTDPNISPQTAKLIQAYGATLITVRNRDDNGGFLGSRIALIKSMMQNDPRLVWTNQYENLHNVEAHYFSTGPEILRQFPLPDYVFVGSGTTGTLGGVSRYLRQHSPETRIIAVDSVGSVTFGFPAGKRHIPGLGTSHPPAIRTYSDYDDILMIDERLTVEMCHRQARRGLFLGGSSGTVLAGVAKMAHLIPSDACVVAISPDMGDRYIDTVYNLQWVEQHFPGLEHTLPGRAEAALEPAHA
ncbi:MAG: 2,3-diaminopropionate biosynthesis protein SbnA [Betaproteobacteria bacterium]|nr:2,3-diaminopropionate biosynthesis protein SbnA [Betaproteobacteria bacterium]